MVSRAAARRLHLSKNLLISLLVVVVSTGTSHKILSSNPTHRLLPNKLLGYRERGGDFLFDVESIENRWRMVQEAKKQWDDGAIISIMW